MSSFIEDVVTRTANRFGLTQADATKMAIEVLQKEISRQAETYVAKVELNEVPVAQLIAFQKSLQALIAEKPASAAEPVARKK